MALPQASRIAFSKIIVAAPASIAAINTVITQIMAAQVNAQIIDTANENIWSSLNTLIDAYQNERQYLTGNVYTTYNETDIENAAKLTSGNLFYGVSGYNIQATVPYGLGYSQGQQNPNGYPSSITPESTLLTNLTSAINSVLAITPNNIANQITGQTCPSGGTGVGGINLTSTSGFTAAVSSANSAASSLASTLSSEISALTTIISTDTNPTRNAAAVTAKTNAQTALTAVNAWIALTTELNYTQSTDLTQVQFNAATASSAAPALLGLDPGNTTKFNPINLAAIQSAITARSSFINTSITGRTAVLTSYFGSFSQNLTTGAISSIVPGFYYSNYLNLQLRIALTGGSLTSLNGFATALAAQYSQIAVINNQVTAYSALLSCSAFSADASDTNQISLLDTALFSPGDAIYFVSDNADELQASINGINGKRITLTQIVPSRYLTSDYARLYKDIS